jgi:hypothetical protein
LAKRGRPFDALGRGPAEGRTRATAAVGLARERSCWLVHGHLLN